METLVNSVEVNSEAFSADPAAINVTRIHWMACPACRTHFPGAGQVIAQVIADVHNRARVTLSELSESFRTGQANEPTKDTAESRTKAIATLVQSGEEVQWALSFVMGEATDFTVPIVSWCPRSLRWRRFLHSASRNINGAFLYEEGVVSLVLSRACFINSAAA